MKFLIVMVIIIKFALILFFLKGYSISDLGDIKSDTNQSLDTFVEGSDGYISDPKKSDIITPLSIDEIDLILDAPIGPQPDLANTQEQLESLTDEQANSSSHLQHHSIRNNVVPKSEPSPAPDFEEKSWVELFQEINKVRSK